MSRVVKLGALQFCRIVKKVTKENKGELSLEHLGENQGTCEDTGKQHGETLGMAYASELQLDVAEKYL